MGASFWELHGDSSLECMHGSPRELSAHTSPSLLNVFENTCALTLFQQLPEILLTLSVYLAETLLKDPQKQTLT